MRRSFSRASRSACARGIDRVEAGEDHRLDVFETGQRLDGGPSSSVMVSPILASATFLMLAIDEADFAGGEFVDFDGLGREHAEGFHFVHLPVRPQPDLLSLAQRPSMTRDQDDRRRDRDRTRNRRSALAAELSAIAFGRRNALHDGFEHIWTPMPALGADEQGIGGIEPDDALDLLLGCARTVGAGQVDLVDDGNDFQVRD